MDPDRTGGFYHRWIGSTFGDASLAAFIICVTSGILLAAPYDIREPYLSVSRMMVTNPSGDLLRNLHYWSAQFFMVFFLLHIYDHLKASTESRVSHGAWSRLALSLIFLGYAMISGFILKGDADSLLAFQVTRSLTGHIPLAGPVLESTFIGGESDLQLVYLHHAATATIILAVVIFEHARGIWPGRFALVAMASLSFMASLFFRAPFYPMEETLLKGPWYFLGVQEILHWMGNPLPLIIFLSLLLLIFLLIPRIPAMVKTWAKKLLLAFTSVYFLLTIIGYFFRGENWSWQWPWQDDYRIKNSFDLRNPFRIYSGWSDSLRTPVVVLGREEGCLHCHGEMKGFSPAHSPEAIGCYACHGGDPFTMDAGRAHRNMILIPGNISTAAFSCGRQACHPGIYARVKTSLMANLTGMITVDRFVFGETPFLSGMATISDLDSSPADIHLRNLCVACHLGSEKVATGPVSQTYRGGGCLACHLNYTDEVLKEWGSWEDQGMKGQRIHHPALSIRTSNSHCFACHSRSGRIATSYEGWHETLLQVEDLKSDSGFRLLDDGRVFEFIEADIHHEQGLACIDCHGSYELMGDGNRYEHKEEAVAVTCMDCHPVSGWPSYSHYTALDRESSLIVGLRGFPDQSDYVLTLKRGHAMTNIFRIDSAFKLTGKLNGRVYPLKPPSPECGAGNVHARLSCGACHTSWVPQCLGCHNQYDSRVEGYDMKESRTVEGSWVEYVGKFMAGAPVLGINEKTNQVGTFTPGMILSIDLASFPGGRGESYHRLYAPASGHTTRREGRSCESCHIDPLAIGFGRGELVYEVMKERASWRFEPAFADDPRDGLPLDAWIGFMKDRDDISSTRSGMRPFNLEEQERILLVGSCLHCHARESDVIRSSLGDWQGVLKRRSPACI